MFNQRGQAFSVFELMIAAIVAVAILFLLLTIMGGIGLTTSNDYKSAISNALLTVKDGGNITTDEFEVAAGTQMASDDFEQDTDLDPKSVYLGVIRDLEDEQFEASINSDNDVSYVSYDGQVTKKVKAKVICKQTAGSLEGALANFPDEDVEDAAGDAPGFCENNIPCCAVILVKR